MKNIKTILLFGCLILGTKAKADFICYYLINTEIKHAVEEHERQKDMHEEQVMITALEGLNANKMGKYDEITKSVKSRLNNLSLAIQAIPTGVKIAKEVEKIKYHQELIYNELVEAPQWIPVALEGQIEFVEMVNLNLRYMAGLILSYGTINQMEKAERKILLDYAYDEIKMLRINSWTTLHKIRTAKARLKQKKQMLESWINRDKILIEDIIRNAKEY